MKAKSTKTKTTRATKPAKETRKEPAKPAPKAAAKPAPKAASPAAKPGKAPRKGETKAPAAKAAPALRSVPPPRKPKPPNAAQRKELAHFRALLLEKQRELMQAYAVSKGDSRSHLDNGTEDYIDYAVNSYAKEFLLSLTELDRKQLLLVEEALRRIDRAEFGRCQQCGEEINRKRLEVAPWARHCVRCQELEEQGLLPQYPFQVEEGDLEGGSEKSAGGDEEDFAPEAEVEEEEPDLDDDALSVGDEEEEE
jgi:DnaK suppressor protein